MDKNIFYGVVIFLNITIICVLMNKTVNAFSEAPNAVDWHQTESPKVEQKPEIKLEEPKPEIKEQLESKPAPSPEVQPKSHREKRILRRQGCPGCPNCQPNNRTICY